MGNGSNFLSSVLSQVIVDLSIESLELCGRNNVDFFPQKEAFGLIQIQNMVKVLKLMILVEGFDPMKILWL